MQLRSNMMTDTVISTMTPHSENKYSYSFSSVILSVKLLFLYYSSTDTVLCCHFFCQQQFRTTIFFHFPDYFFLILPLKWYYVLPQSGKTLQENLANVLITLEGYTFNNPKPLDKEIAIGLNLCIYFSSLTAIHFFLLQPLHKRFIGLVLSITRN